MTARSHVSRGVAFASPSPSSPPRPRCMPGGGVRLQQIQSSAARHSSRALLDEAVGLTAAAAPSSPGSRRWPCAPFRADPLGVLRRGDAADAGPAARPPGLSGSGELSDARAASSELISDEAAGLLSCLLRDAMRPATRLLRLGGTGGGSSSSSSSYWTVRALAGGKAKSDIAICKTRTLARELIPELL